MLADQVVEDLPDGRALGRDGSLTAAAGRRMVGKRTSTGTGLSWGGLVRVWDRVEVIRKSTLSSSL